MTPQDVSRARAKGAFDDLMSQLCDYKVPYAKIQASPGTVRQVMEQLTKKKWIATKTEIDNETHQIEIDLRKDHMVFDTPKP